MEESYPRITTFPLRRRKAHLEGGEVTRQTKKMRSTREYHHYCITQDWEEQAAGQARSRGNRQN